MAKVKVFVTDGWTEGQTDGRMRFNVPMLSRKRGENKTCVCETLMPLAATFKLWQKSLSPTF